MFVKRKDILILVVRLIIGGIFVATGWMKVSAMAQTAGFFHTLGIPVFLAYAVAYAELVGGALIVLGVWTDVAAIVLAAVMIGAIYFTSSGGLQTYGTPLAVLAGLLSIVAAGPGIYTLRLREGTK